jgi:hypothetical protein
VKTTQAAVDLHPAQIDLLTLRPRLAYPIHYEIEQPCGYSNPAPVAAVNGNDFHFSP